jgi:hypothetical protein
MSDLTSRSFKRYVAASMYRLMKHRNFSIVTHQEVFDCKITIHLIVYLKHVERRMSLTFKPSYINDRNLEDGLQASKPTL